MRGAALFHLFNSGSSKERVLLKKEDITDSKIIYNDGVNDIIYNTVVRYIDDKECFIAIQNVHNCVALRRDTMCTLYLYTEKGYYNIMVTIKNASFSLTEVVWELNFSKQNSWKLVERRKGKRKDIVLPVKICYSQTVLSLDIERLSESGFSCKLTKKVNSSLNKLPCEAIIDLSQYPDLNLENNVLQIKAKLIRLYQYRDYQRACFKFTQVFPFQIDAIRKLANNDVFDDAVIYNKIAG